MKPENMFIKTKSGRLVRLPTDEEDAEIQAGIDADPDAAPIATDEDFAKMRPASEMFPDIVARSLKLRGKQKAPTKEQVSIRYPVEILEYFRKSGKGWQTRMVVALQEYVASR